jgi:hypothetical protein
VTACLILRDLVNATLGFERLFKATARPKLDLPPFWIAKNACSQLRL